MSVAREGHVAVLLNSGKVLVAGGYWIPSSGAYPTTAELYDPSNDTWTATGSISTGRRYAEAIKLNDGKVLMIGGDDGSSVLNSADVLTLI